MKSTNYEQFCKELADLDKNIVAAFVLSGSAMGSYLKLNVPQLKQNDVKKLMDQTKTVMDIIKTNEPMFGKVVFMLVNHEFVDGIFFPINETTTVLVGLIRPYEQEQVVKKVKDKIKKSKF